MRWLDAVMMRVMDGLMSIPSILLAIALMALTRASVENVIIAITIAEVPRVVRLVRGVVLSCASSPTSRRRSPPAPARRRSSAPHPAQHAGAADRAGDLHLRLGDDHRGDPVLHRRRHAADHPELGQHHGRGPERSGRCADIVFFPGIFLSLTVLAVNLLGDGLRDALDPRMARRM
jgi:peptide/nickel transport system permease protein